MATSDVDVWAHFNEGGALSIDVVSRTEAEELSMRVAELEDEVSAHHCPECFFPLAQPVLFIAVTFEKVWRSGQSNKLSGRARSPWEELEGRARPISRTRAHADSITVRFVPAARSPLCGVQRAPRGPR